MFCLLNKEGNMGNTTVSNIFLLKEDEREKRIMRILVKEIERKAGRSRDDLRMRCPGTERA